MREGGGRQKGVLSCESFKHQYWDAWKYIGFKAGILLKPTKLFLLQSLWMASVIM